MAVKLRMPKIGLNMEEGQINTWVAKEGQPVKKGDVLYVVETDKITNDVEAPQDGVLIKILVAEGQMVPVREIVGVLAEPGETVDLDFLLKKEGENNPQEKTSAAPAAGFAHQDVPNTKRTGEILASPLAKRLAAQNNINLANITPSGPGGRIQVEDVEKIISGKSAGRENGDLPGKLMPIKGMRKVIAEKMSLATREIPMVMLHSDLDVSAIVAYRESCKVKTPDSKDVPGYNAILVYLTAQKLKDFPYLNARLTTEGIMLMEDINMGVAVDTMEGLTVVVVKNADRKTIPQIHAELSELIQRAVGNKSTAEDLSNGTFTITNLGMYGVDGFTPIINPPEVGILGIGRFREEHDFNDGNAKKRILAQFSLTFDHRVIDGAPAARFLQDLGDSFPTL